MNSFTSKTVKSLSDVLKMMVTLKKHKTCTNEFDFKIGTSHKYPAGYSCFRFNNVSSNIREIYQHYLSGLNILGTLLVKYNLYKV